jgi:hypothetical protein
MDPIEGHPVTIGNVPGDLKGIEAVIVQKAISGERTEVLPRHGHMEGYDDEKRADH